MMFPNVTVTLIMLLGIGLFGYGLKNVYLAYDELFVYGCVFGIVYSIIAFILLLWLGKNTNNKAMNSANTVLITIFLLISVIPFSIMATSHVNNDKIEDETAYEFKTFELGENENGKLEVKGTTSFDTDEEPKEIVMNTQNLVVRFEDINTVKVKRIRDIVSIDYPIIKYRTPNLQNKVSKYVLILPENDKNILLQVFPDLQTVTEKKEE